MILCFSPTKQSEMTDSVNSTNTYERILNIFNVKNIYKIYIKEHRLLINITQVIVPFLTRATCIVNVN